MSVVVDGKLEDVPGVSSTSWREDPRVPPLSRGGDARPRSTRWIRGIVLHTTKGIPGGRDHRPQKILPGLGPSLSNAERVARYWSTEPKPSGAHLVVDHDGHVACAADLLRECAFHAGPVNDVSIGIEIYQGSEAELYAGQLEATVLLCDWLTRRFGIQRQIPDTYLGPLDRLEAGGRNVVGVYGHRDVTGNRGAGDPGDAIFERLAAAGYERFNFDDDREMRATWRERQWRSGIEAADGIPGPATVRALTAAGRKHGMWVARPGD